MERLRCKTVALLARMAWPIWIAYAIAWSLALLTPQPIHVRDAVLSEQPAIFSSKLVHIGGYMIFTILSGWLRLPLPFRWSALAFLSLHALGTEYLQQFVPKRTPSLIDVGLDHIGIVLGLALTWKWWLGNAGADSDSSSPGRDRFDLGGPDRQPPQQDP